MRAPSSKRPEIVSNDRSTVAVSWSVWRHGRSHRIDLDRRAARIEQNAVAKGSVPPTKPGSLTARERSSPRKP